MASSIPELYNARAQKYDIETTFHRTLATQYVKYAKPKAGESVLDLACGTGLVTIQLASIVQNVRQSQKPKVVGIDIAKGMLDVALEKFGEDECKGLEVKFLESDIANLTELEGEGLTNGSFDIITVCSALVLLGDPQAAIQHWAQYLKPGGRMVVDIPHNKSMLSNKILSLIAPDFGLRILGDRNWIKGAESLEWALEGAGLKAEVIETDIFDDIPARTEQGRSEWLDCEGGAIFDQAIKKGTAFTELEPNTKSNAKKRFEEEWAKLASGVGGIVREEGRLWVGIGTKI